MKKLQLEGQTFGYLIVVSFSHTHNRNTYWNCQCKCGKTIICCGVSLKHGNTQSCGCFHIERSIEANIKHGFRRRGDHRNRLYNIWYKMKARCYNENDNRYKYYGKRGIKVCDEWKNDFIAFSTWSLSNGYQDNLEIDRRKNNKDYSPENCRWVTSKTNQNNKSNNRRITYNGSIHTVAEWAEILNIKYATLHNRLYRGWSIEKSLNQF
jgi:hypothetical protein